MRKFDNKRNRKRYSQARTRSSSPEPKAINKDKRKTTIKEKKLSLSEPLPDYIPLEYIHVDKTSEVLIGQS